MRTVFDQVRIVDVDFHYTKFIDCTLGVRTSRSVFFRNCHFERCTFRGRPEFIFDSSHESRRDVSKFRNSCYFRKTFVDPDFSEASLQRMEFIGCVFDGDVRLPESEEVLVIEAYGRLLSHIPRHSFDEFKKGIRTGVFLDRLYSFLPVRSHATLYRGGFTDADDDEGLDQVVERMKAVANEHGLKPPVYLGGLGGS